MKSYSLCIVCKEKINEVRNFLGQFLEEIKDKYTYEDWVSFSIPESKFNINLMKGENENLTQNLAIELGTDSLERLKELASKYNKKIKSFVSSESKQNYTYYYIEIPGPKNICNVVISYCEDMR